MAEKISITPLVEPLPTKGDDPVTENLLDSAKERAAAEAEYLKVLQEEARRNAEKQKRKEPQNSSPKQTEFRSEPLFPKQPSAQPYTLSTFPHNLYPGYKLRKTIFGPMESWNPITRDQLQKLVDQANQELGASSLPSQQSERPNAHLTNAHPETKPLPQLHTNSTQSAKNKTPLEQAQDLSNQLANGTIRKKDIPSTWQKIASMLTNAGLKDFVIKGKFTQDPHYDNQKQAGDVAKDIQEIAKALQSHNVNDKIIKKLTDSLSKDLFQGVANTIGKDQQTHR